MTRKKVYIGLSAITILVGGALVIWMVFNSGGIIDYYPRSAYDTIKPQIQNAVTDFAVTHNGSLPPCEDTPFDVYDTHSKTTITCNVFDICSIVGTGDLLRRVPDGCYGNASVTNSNFYNASAYMGCTDPNDGTGHYVWVIDSSGNVFSMCDENRDGVYNSTDRVDGLHPIGKYASQDIIWP